MPGSRRGGAGPGWRVAGSGGGRRVRLRGRHRDGQREQVQPGRGGDGVAAFADSHLLDGVAGGSAVRAARR